MVRRSDEVEGGNGEKVMGFVGGVLFVDVMVIGCWILIWGGE